MPCELCASEGGIVLWRDAFCRVVRVETPDPPGFCRVVLARHVCEMTDLAAAERDRLMHTVFAVEAVLRGLLRPHKINLASLGNRVPHLHWHVVPRFGDDARFPAPVWAPARRVPAPRPPPGDAALARALGEALR